MSEVIKCFECGELFERLNCEHVCEPDQKARLWNLWYSQIEHAERRDRFATAALTGLLASPNSSGRFEDYVEDARKYADFLLAELDKPQE